MIRYFDLALFLGSPLLHLTRYLSTSSRKNQGDFMSSDIGNAGASSTPARNRYLYLLLFVPFIALLWLPFYNFAKPALMGFPFFYWYQLLWVPLTSLIIYIVYRGTR